jgi:poly(3-hydroxybutyrate) depolymerase
MLAPERLTEVAWWGATATCALLYACGGHNDGTNQLGQSAGGSANASAATGGSSVAVSGGAGKSASAGSTAPVIAGSHAAAAGSGGQSASAAAGMTAAAAGVGAGVPTGEFGDTGQAGTGGALAPAAGSGGAGGAPDTAPPCATVIPPSMDCTAKLAPGDERMCTLGTRQYIVHAGKTLNACEPVALVIDAHGATETAPQQLGTEMFCTGMLCWSGLGSGWAAESDTPGGGFIAVFPQGLNNMWQASDADFMLQIVDEMKKLANIDPKKVYISGISNGGFLTFQTGCPHSDVFHGMAPNSGGSNCDSVKAPIPLISFDAMPDFAYDGHKTANMSVVTANHCKGDAKPWLTIDKTTTDTVCRSAKNDKAATLVPCNTVMADIKPTVCKIWDDCDPGSKVVWCDVAPNDEHGASNAATDAHILYENNTILNTPSLAWRFFKSFW